MIGRKIQNEPTLHIHSFTAAAITDTERLCEIGFYTAASSRAFQFA
jgi:hypothetical protein